MIMRHVRAVTALCAFICFPPALLGCQAHDPPRLQAQSQVTLVVAGPEVPEGTPIVHRSARSPMTLTASDGTGLRLASVVSRSVVEGPLAFTELHLAFDNPEGRSLEGRFDITLPPGATVGRFAMLIDGGWQEAEVVETKAAREAYEDFLHRKQDPALLEQAAGNGFSARVFPIPPHARKEIIISYAQELTTGSTPVVPLQGLAEVDLVDVSARHAHAAQPFQAVRKEKFKPTGDFGFDPSTVSKGAGIRAGNLTIVRVRPKLDARPDPMETATILVDTSASRALGFEDELRLLDQVVLKVAADGGPGAKVAIACFDQATDVIFEGAASSFGEAERSRIRARQALGASDLEQALRWAGQHSKAHGIHRLVVITDGVATAGEIKQDRIRTVIGGFTEAGIERFDVIAVGGLRDAPMLRGLVASGLARDGVVAEGDRAASELTSKLTQRTRSDIAVQVEGATWSWPTRIDGVQPGDELIVYADVAAGQPVKVKLGSDAAQAYDLAEVDRPLVERAWARARIESLLERQRVEGPKSDLIEEIIALSTRHRVLSPYTSMLVLETEADYARFRIDRRALSDILVVKDDRVMSMHRDPFDAKASPSVRVAQNAPATPIASASSAAAAPREAERVIAAPPHPMAPEPIGEAVAARGLGLTGIGEGGGGRGEGIGLGSIGTLGHGAGTGTGQGFGTGSGRLAGSHRSSSPQVRAGATAVSGRLPTEVIQRIVRQNYGRFRLCYENGLRSSPSLQGRVSVRFVIDKWGVISNISNAGSDLPSTAVVACVVRAFQGLSFPQPDGGIVTVVYPIIFGPGAGSGLPGSPQVPDDKPAVADPYTGRFKEVMTEISAGRAERAMELALAWHAQAPGDVLGYVALGEAAEARSDWTLASRAYGSIIDLYPARADLRRFAGERLERVHDPLAQRLALDAYAKAREQRPDHPSSHRLLAFAQLREGQHEAAFTTLVQGLTTRYPAGRFAGVRRVLKEDLGLIAAAWTKAQPARAGEILGRLKKEDGTIENGPSLRFVLNWETDANDVDFHIYDDKGGHAFFGQRVLKSGGELYEDVTTGYGPECFTIRKPKALRAAVYTLQANYYSRGPMGYGMGKLQVIDHDGKGSLSFEERPYVVMADRAFVDLGSVKR